MEIQPLGCNFASEILAALDFYDEYFTLSWDSNQEYFSWIYRIKDKDGKCGYTYTKPAIGEKGKNGKASVTPPDRPFGTNSAAHTHGRAYTSSDDSFSGTPTSGEGDRYQATKGQFDLFLMGPYSEDFYMYNYRINHAYTITLP